MNTVKKIIYTFCIALIFNFIYSIEIYSQSVIKGQVVEKETKIPIAFASVVVSSTLSQKGTVTDVNGMFEIATTDLDFLEVSCVGYHKIRVERDALDTRQHHTIELPKSVITLNEVVVSAKYNPAIPVVQNVLKNKSINDHEKYDSYSFLNYIKTSFDVKLSAEATAEDSARFFKKKEGGEFRDMAALLMEYVIQESKTRAKVSRTMDAYKISGLEKPEMAQIFASLILSSVSFYKNDITFVDISGVPDKTKFTFIGPFADNCLKLYEFQLENTLIGNNDTLFHITFAPQKGKLFNGLKGSAFISSNGYALKTLVVEPTQPGLMNFRIVQEHATIRNRWFPARLDSEVSVKYKKLYEKTKALLVINLTSNIDSVFFGEYDLEYVQKQSTDPATVPEIVAVSKTLPNTRTPMDVLIVNPEAVTRSGEILEKIRPTPLTLREKETYRVIDSVFKEFQFEKYATAVMSFTFGRLPIAIVDLDVFDMARLQ